MTFEKELRTIIGFASKHPIVILSGPRGCGKDRLSRLAFPQKSYIDFEDQNVLKLAARSPRTFLLAFPDGAIINEYDRVPNFLEAVRYLVDRWGFHPGRYILISSRHTNVDNMGGRLVHYQMAGLSMSELEMENISTNNPFSIMCKGQLPFLLEGMTAESLIDSIIEKDVSKHINGCNREQFKSFLTQCALCSAEQLSMNRIARACGVSAPTAKTWISILQLYNVVRILHGDEPSKTQLFFCDSGLLCHLLGIVSAEELVLSPHRDRVARTFAFSELMRGRFSKALPENIGLGRVCDFKAQWRGSFKMIVDPNIEVTEESRRRIKEIRKPGKTVVLYLGDVTYTIGNTDCISFRDWEKLAKEIDYFS